MKIAFVILCAAIGSGCLPAQEAPVEAAEGSIEGTVIN